MSQIQTRLICFVLVIIAPFLCVAQEDKLRQDASEDVKLGKPTAFQPVVQPDAPDGNLTLLVELHGKPAAQVYAEQMRAGARSADAATAIGKAIQLIRTQQDALRKNFAKIGAVELYAVERVLNAIVIRTDASKIRELQKLPGVKQVSLAPRHYIENATSVPFIGANTVWDTTGALSTLGLTGNGVTIAVIDTGIDYVHANFAGTVNYTGQDPNVISDGIAFPTAKVINGFDFVGDNYDANGVLGSPTPVPDPDPTDCNGHGSHVAGSAAGTGVDGGVTYTGGYDNLTAGTLAGFDIGPGVAPEASLIALKVFGCAGSTDVVLQAIDFAVDPNGDDDFSDHYDVINMSLGSSYGFSGQEIAIQNAVAAGVIVVTSSGNSGDVHYITGTPGSANEAISVAASNDNGNIAASLEDVGNAQSYYAIPAAFGPALTTPTPAVPAIIQIPPGSPLGCNAADFTGFTAGNIALIDRGTCNFTVKVKNAQNAGATAAVVVNTVDNIPTVMGGSDPTITIPSVQISNDSGNLLKPALPTTGQLDPNGAAQADILASFSSRGPRRKNLSGAVALKPDVTAPGANIFSTRTCYTGTCVGNEGAFNSGTSMASPHVAGVMALLREQYSAWSVEDLKALLMNTATNDVFSVNIVTGGLGARWGTSRIGAGRVDVENATTEEVIAYSTDNAAGVGITFSGDLFLNNLGPQLENKTITVENNTGTSVTYNLSIDTVNDATGVSFSISPSSITVGPNSTSTFTVTVTYTPAAMTHVRDVNSSSVQGAANLARHWISEETGYAVLDAQSGATVDLRVPLYSAPRPASDMDSPTLVNTGAQTGVVSIPLTGVQVNQGAGATLYRSRVSAFELLHTSPEVNPGPDLWDGGDIQYVGVSSDIPVGGARSYFGISMYGDWDTPRMREVQLCLDLNQDGTGGAFGDGTDWCFIARPETNNTDAFMVFLRDINNFLGAGANAEFSISEYQNVNPTLMDTRIFNNSVMFLASGTTPAYWNALIGAATIKYTGGNTTDPGQAFNFKLMTVDLNDPLVNPPLVFTDTTPVLTFDPTNSRLSPAEGFFGVAGRMVPIVDDLNATAFDFVFNLTQPDGKADVLMLHLYNLSGDRADLVTIQAPPTVPVLVSPADGATTNNPTPTFDWNDSTGGGGATQYQIQVDNNNDFSSPEIDTTVAVSTFTPGSPLANNTYFWRVRAIGATGAISAWSTVWSVTIDSTLRTLTIAGAGTGNGTMTDTTPGSTISCTSTAGTESGDCTESTDSDTVFAIVAAPDGSSDFGGWTGCDSTSGTNNEVCNFTLTADRTVTADFSVEPTLTVAGSGLGTGTLTDTTPGSTISCTSTAGTESGDCIESTDSGTVFAIIASPDATSDFGGWTGCDSTSGTNNEICNVTLTADTTVSADFSVEPILTVAGSGLGTGTMNDTTPGSTISCTSTAGTESGDCSEQPDSGTVFAIVATPDSNSDFGGWTGCDSTSGTNNEVCNFTLTADRTVTADFSVEPTLTVAGSGLGTGTMNDTTPGSTIICTSTAGTESGDCSDQPDSGTVFAIVATPDSNSDFGSWTGCDSTSGTNNEICNVTLTTNTIVMADFSVEPILTVAGSGLGTGTMNDTTPGSTISCTSTAGTESGDCSEQPDSGTVFALTATPVGASEFAGWTGCDSTSGTNNEICNVTLNADTIVIADFSVEPTLTVAGSGTGNGTMSDSTPGSTISCTSTAGTESGDCAEQTSSGTVFVITAMPAFLNTFTGWTGCDSTSGANNEICNVTLNSDTTVTAGFEPIPYLLFDDFEDGVLDWDVRKGSCQETSGGLVCTGSRALVFAPQPWSPSGAFGCSTCTVEVEVQTSGGTFGKIILNWHQDKKNGVELIVKEELNKLVFKQRSGGVLVAKESAPFQLDPGVTYTVSLQYNGAEFVISVNGQVLMTVPAGAVQASANFGFKVVQTTATIEEIRVSD